MIIVRTRCIRCKRILKNVQSIKLNIGPACLAKLTNKRKEDCNILPELKHPKIFYGTESDINITGGKIHDN